MPPSFTSAATVASHLLGTAQDVLDMLGQVVDEVTVEVWGNGPNASKAGLFKLAAATAFGIVKRLGPEGALIPPPGLVAVEYDAADNYLKFSLQYNNTLAAILAVNAKIFGGPGTDTLFDQMPVLSGPKDTVVGGEWHFHGPGLGHPVLGVKLDIPELKFAKKTILTKEPESVPPDPEVAGLPVGKTLNPRPSADARTRGAWVGMVYSALTQPGTTTNMMFPEPPRPGDADALDRFRGK